MFLSMGTGIPKTIHIASDHAGFEFKEFLIDKLKTRGYTVNNLGPHVYDPDDDYPDYVKSVGEILSKDQADDVGIVVCKNGVGVSVLANKFRNVRCALSWNPAHIKSARNDDNVNCLALPADYITKETALEVALAFLETPFSAEERHVRRLSKYGNSGNL